jgi:hypothetical protein
MLFIGLWRWYINMTILILDIFHRPVFYLELKLYRFVRTSQETHHVSATSPAQQVNAIYRFATI